jgi:hypothetical protein
MAVYFLRSKHLSRGKGARATRAAAYRAGERIHDQGSQESQECARAGGCRNFVSGETALKGHGALSLGTVLYNPLGNILSGMAAPTGIEYMHAMCDLDGMIRIVELELQARLQHMNDEQLAQFALDGGARYANPFTGEPMHVDVARKTIDFQPLAPRDRVFFPWPLAAAPAGASLPRLRIK